MKRIALVIVTLVAAMSAQAVPQQDEGAMQQLLSEKGLVGRAGASIQEFAGHVTNTTSELIFSAIGHLGVPYKRGGNSVEAGGFDCSGFVRSMYQQTVGLVLPRRAEEQASATQTIDKSELQPGDLVFFNTMRRAFSHVGIYIGDNKFVHSPRTGKTVRVEDMSAPYWQNRFDGARRVSANQAGAPNN